MTEYGRHPEPCSVRYTLGDGANLRAVSENGWAGPVLLRHGPRTDWDDDTVTIDDVGTIDGTEVTWTLTEEQVRARAEHDWVRLEDNGLTLQAGRVSVWRGGLGVTTTQTIASLTAGPPGPTAVSADPDNVAIISPNDGLIYVPPGSGGGGLSVIDNGDGTLTIDGEDIIDNLDGTLTIGA